MFGLRQHRAQRTRFALMAVLAVAGLLGISLHAVQHHDEGFECPWCVLAGAVLLPWFGVLVLLVPTRAEHLSHATHDVPPQHLFAQRLRERGPPSLHI